MTIKDFYGKLGDFCLNIGLLFNLLALLSVIFLIFMDSGPWASLIFVFLSIIYFLAYRFFRKRQEITLTIPIEQKNMRDLPQYVAEKGPDGIYFFQSNGELVYAMEKSNGFRKSYQLTTPEGRQEIIFKHDGFKGKVLIYNHDQEIGCCREGWGKRSGSLIWKGMCLSYYKKNPFQWSFYANERMIAERKKGILPISWTEYFRLNRPYIAFQEKAEQPLIEAVLLSVALLEGK